MRVVSSRPFATKIHWIVAALWLAALSLPAWSEISWIDTYKSKGWPNSTASCVQGEAEARVADLRTANPNLRFRYISINVNEFDPGNESICQFVIERSVGNIWVTYSENSDDELSSGGSDPCPLGSTDDSGKCMPKNAGPPNCCNGSNPIDGGTGNKYQREDDYQGASAFPLAWRRHYNSLSTESGPLGNNWRHHYQRSIAIIGVNGDSASAVKIYREDGKRYELTLSGSTWQPPADVPFQLTQLFSSGVPSGWQLTTLQDDVETYDSQGRLISIALRSGQTQALAYDSGGNLMSVTDPDGRQLTFAYDGSGRISTVTIPGGTTLSYAYDSSNRLQSVTYPDSSRSYLYGESAFTTGASLPNALTGITDESGVRYASFTYDSQFRAIQSVHAGGADSVSFSYGSGGSTSVTDSLGTARTFSYATVVSAFVPSGVSQYSFPMGTNAKSIQYDANGNVSVRTDYNNVQMQYIYDLNRDLETSRTEAAGTARARTITTTWNANFRVPAEIVEPNRTTDFTYDGHGNPLTRKITDQATSQSRTWTYTYDSLGRVLTVTGPRTDVSDVTTYMYYSCTTGAQCGRVQTITNAVGQVTTFNTYNAHGQPLTITDPNNVVTTLTYDARQRLTSSSLGGETTTFTYWPTGLLKQVTLPDSSYVQYTYDGAHRLTRIADRLGNTISYTLDAAGNRTAENVADPSGVLHRTHTRVFNSLSLLYQDINAANTAAVTTTFGYDNNANQITMAAPVSRNTTNVYDELNRLSQIDDPGSGITKFTYDGNDNLVSLVDPRTLTTSYSYNGFGDLTTLVSPDTGATANTYDLNGNLLTSTDARGAVSTYTYDALNRVTSVAYTIGGTADQAIVFAYDSGSNGKGRLTGVSDANNSMSWAYDALGRVTSKSQTVGSTTESVAYGYANGDLTTLTTPSGQAIGYGYNTNHQIASVTVNGTTVLSGATYEPLGPVNGWTWGNGTTVARTYDTDGKITQVASNGTKTYAYDNAFRITGITDTSTGAANWTYGYDALDRITSGTSPSTTRGWTYDADGNRLTEGGSAPSTYSISPTNNRITAITGALARSYGYDAAGNTTSYATATVTYNNAGRLKTLTQGGTTEIAVYNALGQRIQKSGGTAGTVLYAYDEAGRLLGEYDGTGALIQETVWLGGIPVVTLRPNGTGIDIFYVHTDQLNTPRAITRPADNMLMWTWYSDPFGTDAANENPAGAGTFAYNLRFPGQLFDGQAGLHEKLNREYDPATSSYTQSDPIGLYGGINTYAYVNRNPMMYIDPFGLASCPPNVRNFFATLDGPLSAAATGLKMDVYALEALSALESGWYGPHAQELNNPFGLTQAGHDDLSFPSVDAAVAYFEQHIGPKVSGSQDIDSLIANMRKPPAYNSVNPAYDKKLRQVYKSVKKYRKDCGCEK